MSIKGHDICFSNRVRLRGIEKRPKVRILTVLIETTRWVFDFNLYHSPFIDWLNIFASYFRLTWPIVLPLGMYVQTNKHSAYLTPGQPDRVQILTRTVPVPDTDILVLRPG